jgi:UDP-3-O-[3-hydroxymyristoyl] glucosamine N-acyltransferase
MRISEFASAVQAQVEGLTEDFEIRSLTTLSEAQEGDVSFVAKSRYANEAQSSHASAIIVPEGTTIKGRTTLAMKEPWAGVLFLLNHLFPAGRETWFEGVHADCFVDPTAELAPDVTVGPCAVIGPRTKIGAGTIIGPGCVIGQDCEIGENCLFNANMVLGHEVKIGNRVLIQPGAIIGADGFKFEVIDGTWTKIPQIGRVVVEDDVEIGANTCIDRASFTETHIGAGTKIDNLVQIAHNVQVGRSCVIVSQSGIAGSTTIGDGSILAAAVGVADNLKIGKRCVLLARAGLKDNVPDGETFLGTPAGPFRKAARIMAMQQRLPELNETVARLEARVKELEERLMGK